MSNTQKIDLHVHSKYAGKIKLFVLNSLAVDESHTEPEDLYHRMMQRGMSMVTITDHDAIEGCLEIAHHGPHVFISEEISARFPDNGCIVHVLAYGITEAQHTEIQRLRYDIYQLVPYLREQNIRHALAHPFSPVNQRLTPAHLQRSLLLFDTLESINGLKDPGHEHFVQQVVKLVDRNLLAEWAEHHRLPIDVDLERTWGITGGSDDHCGLTMASGWTEYDGEPTIEGLRKAFDERRTNPTGLVTTGRMFAHTAHVGALNYFLHNHRSDRKQTYHHIVELAKSGKIPARLDDLAPAVQRLLPAALETLGRREEMPDPKRLQTEGHTPELHDELYELINGTMLGAFRASFDVIKQALATKDPEPIIDELPTLLRLSLFNLPYYFGLKFFHGERGRGRALYETLELEPRSEKRRIALFCDALDNVDGVNIGLRRIARELRAEGHEVFLCGNQLESKEASDDEEAHVVRFPTIGEFPLLGYEQYVLGWPSLVEILQWLDNNEIDAIGLTTPGPLGLVGMLAARMLDIPTVGQYHTNVPEYAFRIIGDRTIGRIVRAYTSWFYGSLGEVVVPSHATAEILLRDGIHSGRVHVVHRGVDTDHFHPSKAIPGYWSRYGLDRNKCTLAYVGRVSVEKNLPFLADIIADLFDSGELDFQFAVVGDGPWLEKMKERLAGYPVAFTGYLENDELATAFASADTFVFPSTTDTFGNVVLESLASGTPALVSELGGPAEIVQHNDSGWILPAEDPGEWRRAIVDLVRDPDARARMGKAGRRHAEGFTYERARDDLWRVYAGAVDRHRERERSDVAGPTVERAAPRPKVVRSVGRAS